MKTIHTLGSTQVSRRSLLIGGAAAGSASLLTASAANANVKVSKAAVRFSAVSTNGKNCSSCKLFVPSSSCMFVEGPTTPDGYCWIWRSKNA
jgi:secreted PhoX family phosphatase